MSTVLSQRVAQLNSLGIVSVSLWGGGKASRGRDHRTLADAPPSLAEQLDADYRGGLGWLASTATPAGGYTVNVDVDDGPQVWPALPRGTLAHEDGTHEGSAHLAVAVTDRMEGTIVIYAPRIADERHPEGHWLAELKCYGTAAMRAWPTVPPDKRGGYTPRWTAPEPVAPALTTVDLAHGLADYLSRVVHITQVRVRMPGQALPNMSPLANPDVAILVAALDSASDGLRVSGSRWARARRCPWCGGLATLSVDITTAAYRCHRAACGIHGGPRSLAHLLGIQVRFSRPGTRWEVSG